MMQSPILLFSIILLWWTSSGAAFVVRSHTTNRNSHSVLWAELPTFDASTQRWSPALDEESAASAYNALGSLLRQGPKAYLARVTNPDGYDQECLEYMAQEKCTSYQMAQGNVDRRNENLQDWMEERMQAKGRTIDYVTLDTKQILLTVVWGGFISLLLGRILYLWATGGDFNNLLYFVRFE